MDDEDWNRSEQDWIDFAVLELRRMHMIPEDAPILNAHCEKVEKAYPAYFDTYSQIDELVLWLDSVKNMYCIGRNGQHRYNNMDHSMVTAFYTVDNILNGVKDKSNIWNVNTEKDYHEEMKDE